MTVIIMHRNEIEAHEALNLWFFKNTKKMDMLIEDLKEKRYRLVDIEKEEIESVSIDGQMIYDSRLED